MMTICATIFWPRSAISRQARRTIATPISVKLCARSTNSPSSMTRPIISTIAGLHWFQCIQDIHHRMLQKDLRLVLQVDVTATPRHDNGAIFVQTVSDYPLVEAIAQNVVKHPVLPDAPSRAKLTEHKSPIITEKFADYLQLGIEEWRKSYTEHEKLGKKAVLFVMVDDTKNCDEVGSYLEKICPELQGVVLVIHTKANGEISESPSSKNRDELEILRQQSNEIDTWKSPYKAIVSVLMLKEG
jgi:type III restriction enzyme